MSDIHWTTNCILFGAKLIEMIKQGKDEDALTEIRNLTSAFDDITASYLLMRLKEL